MAHIPAGGGNPPAGYIIAGLSRIRSHTAEKMVRSLAPALLLVFCLAASAQSDVPTSSKNKVHKSDICAAPDSVDFGKIGVRGASAPSYLTITNCGKSSVAIAKVSTSNPQEFTDINSCPLQPLTLAPGAACTVGVRFFPRAEGKRQSDLLISWEKDSVTVPLSGVGVASTTNLSTTHIVFLPQLLETQSKRGSVVIRNKSTDHALRFDSVKVEGEFILTPALLPCAVPGELAPSATCNLSVSFAPRTLGSVDGRLIINDSDSASPHVIGLHGTATAIKVSPTQLDWNRTVLGDAGEPKKFIISAVGEHAIEIENIETHGDFEQHNSCGKELLGGASCSVTVTFKPTESGKRVGGISIIDSDPTKVQSVFLIGRGGIASLLPSALVFEPQKMGTTSAPQTLTFKNYGNSPLNISSIDVGGDFAVPAKTCGESLQAGQSCTVSVVFLPARSGSANGSVAVHESGDRSPIKVTLTGTGIESDHIPHQ